MTDRNALHRSIDHRAPEQEWSRLFQWIEETTVRVMDSNTLANPWLKAVPEEKLLLPATAFYVGSGSEEVEP